MTDTNKNREAFEAEKENYGYMGKPLAWQQGFDKGWKEAYQAALSHSADRIAELEALSKKQYIDYVLQGKQLAEATATIAEKDEFIEPLTKVAGKEVNGNRLHRLAITALALTPSQEVLDGYVKSRLEKVVLIAADVDVLSFNRDFNNPDISEENKVHIALQGVFNRHKNLYTLKPADESEA